MEFIYFTDQQLLPDKLKNGIAIEDNYRGKGVLFHPLIRIQAIAPASNEFPEFIDDQNRLNNEISIEELWQELGALGLRQHNKKVAGIVFSLDNENWPIKVHIDLRDKVAPILSEKLENSSQKDVKYAHKISLSEAIKNIGSKKYVMESSFHVQSEKGLLGLIEKFEEAGGGVWSAQSIDCTINQKIKPQQILRTVDY
ncbi:hypothetical protein K6119_08095 [Paracrocinitomix mangrovi]|uniref:hypothetical protein n=1 Tax=Paracrocinitomix mangrovi TaxID=2862509 RepID=UPI001C8D0972|nr:hypothetical protein [Paracrocinitomix mangrovi]UKN03473.1 hypothetical protein K6119_08095 [Paracrocinitomix mangrovi]